MERTSRFAQSFVGKAVMSGSKPSGSAFPEITAVSTKDKFSLNKKAMALMGLAENSYVVLIDQNRGKVVTDDHNQRFFITKGWTGNNGQPVGAKVAKNGVFSYAGVYSAIHMDDPSIDEATTKDMVNSGKGIFRDTKGGNESFIALQKVSFKLQELTESYEEDGETKTTNIFEVAPGIHQEVYAMVDYTVTPHDPKSAEDADVTEEAEA